MLARPDVMWDAQVTAMTVYKLHKDEEVQQEKHWVRARTLKHPVALTINEKKQTFGGRKTGPS